MGISYGYPMPSNGLSRIIITFLMKLLMFDTSPSLDKATFLYWLVRSPMSGSAPPLLGLLVEPVRAPLVLWISEAMKTAPACLESEVYGIPPRGTMMIFHGLIGGNYAIFRPGVCRSIQHLYVSTFYVLGYVHLLTEASFPPI